ncbi:N-acetyltransferase [Bacillus xiapuensis]|uniref:N-acetyltransferase n=1 Tax=Bacillus xiapuensis TaxID=2014075 RepID=UPI000C23C94E|nr:N-acetyltransferase [Bacillus xiapuensis]
MEITNATTGDVQSIYQLIQMYAKKEIVLPRSILSLYQHIQSLYVMKEEDQLLGVAGLHVLGEDLGEVRSLVVAPGHEGKGIGRQLVEHVINEAARLGVNRVISLTYETAFFEKCGFAVISKEELPEKTWIDCMNCPKLECCDEIAMIRYIG